MKTIMIFGVALVLVFAVGVCQADAISIGDALKTAPEVNEGFAYSVIDSQWKPTTTAVAKSFGKLNLGYGVTTAKEKVSLNQFTEVIGQVSYTVVKASDVDALKNIPVINLLKIEPYVAGGYKDIGFHKSGDNEWDALIGNNFISTKW